MKRIVVADDSDFVRKAVCRLLQSQPDFIIVGQANNGREAVKKAEALQPEVIVLDVSMPELNGMEAAPIIWRLSPNTKIVFLTQYPAPSDIAGQPQNINWAYVLKSQVDEDLIATIRNV